ncbi:MAG: hypothetical protein K2J90_02305 [Lachnospiraceae bacterium]|nr:hypothetical protein [Lachnospiraceae bacterium]
MKIIIRNLLIVIVICLMFFFFLPLFNPEGKQEEKKENLELYDKKLINPIEDSNHIAILGITMPFPLKISELPAEFHIEDMYYDEMTDGIDAGDYFHCNLLNEENEEIAYIRVTNLKQNKAVSPDEMTITYIEASAFRHDDKEYAVPFEIYGGVGIGDDYQEVKNVFSDAEIDEKEEYAIVVFQLGSKMVTLEFLNQKVHKMSVKTY